MSVILAILECIEDRGTLEELQLRNMIEAIENPKLDSSKLEDHLWGMGRISEQISVIEDLLVSHFNSKYVENYPLL